MAVPRIQPIFTPVVPLPPGPTRNFTVPPTRGIRPPEIRLPNINEPRIELPTSIPQDMEPGPGRNDGAAQDDTKTRELPDPNTILTLPPDPPVTIPVPFTEFAVPAPDAQILSTTASAAFVATTSALAATTALKPIMDSLFKVLKAVFKKAMQKLTNKKPPDYSGTPTTEVDLKSLDRFRFDSARCYQGPQYPRKDSRKGKTDVEKPQPESSQHTSEP